MKLAGTEKSDHQRHGRIIHPCTRHTKGWCLNTMTVHVFPNKAYKLQKWYIWHMIHKPRHISACKWIARVAMLNNYPMEFPTPSRVVPRKLDQKELLEVLEDGTPTLWKFQMDKKGFDASPGTIKEFNKMYD
eukprot:6203591-Ditylum_brightwellii.AAC.2